MLPVQARPPARRIGGALILIAAVVFGGGGDCCPDDPGGIEGMFDCDPSKECCGADGTCSVGKDCFSGGINPEGSCHFGAGGGMGMGTCFCGDKLEGVETEFYSTYRAEHGGFEGPQGALEMFETGCAQDVSSSCLFLGLLLADGIAGETDYPRAAQSVLGACQQGNATGCFYYGAALELGVGVEQDHDLASGFFEQACAGGEPFGCDPGPVIEPIAGASPSGAFASLAAAIRQSRPCG